MHKRIIGYGKAIVFFLDRRIEEIMIVSLCSILVSSLTFVVIVRYALPIPVLTMASHWAEEAATFSFIWLLYWGASLATKKGEHFRITAQFGLLTKRVKKYALLPGDIAWLLFNLVIIKLGWELLQFSQEASLSLEIPMKYVYAIIPLSFIFILFRLIQYNFKAFKAQRNQGDDHNA